MVPIGAPAAAGTGASCASGLFGSSTASSGSLFGASSGAGALVSKYWTIAYPYIPLVVPNHVLGFPEGKAEGISTTSGSGAGASVSCIEELMLIQGGEDACSSR